jgi:tetratricopeptide (TPR) repeat protein
MLQAGQSSPPGATVLLHVPLAKQPYMRCLVASVSMVLKYWGHEVSPDAHFQLALSQALQGNLEAALVEFKTALTLSPRLADADFEIGGIYLKKKNYREALKWVQKGLRLEPRSDYGLDLAGTLCFLMDAKIEALRYWNGMARPHLTGIYISSTTQLDRQSIADKSGTSIHLFPANGNSWLTSDYSRMPAADTVGLDIGRYRG